MHTMFNNYNINYKAFTDKALLQKMGASIKHLRLKINKTQAQLAADAGINRSTLIELESGGGANLLTFIQVMRALGRLDFMNFFEIETELSPLQLAEMQAKYKTRLRASKSKPKDDKKSDW